MIVTRLTDPAEIITVDEVREFCRVEAGLNAYSDRELSTLINAAIETGEMETGAVWREAEYEELIINPPLAPGYFCLSIRPVTGVKAMAAISQAGDKTAIGKSDYELIPSDLENRRPWASVRMLTSWPADTERVRLKIKAGWTADNLPEALRLWALNRVASSNEWRGDMQVNVTSTPRKHVDRLLDRYRIYGG